jgi:micrococcal nuclease
LKVARVIDGDTLQLSTGETVRLIGVDTPETKDPRQPVQHFGKEATAFTRQLVEGKPVHLEYDQQRRDKYGRSLA